jgi:hypothetical protein
MTLINRSDVKNHLSTRSGSNSMFPAGLTQPDAASAAVTSGATETTAHGAEIAISPNRTISAEAAPNLQAGESVGLPAKSGNPGSPS